MSPPFYIEWSAYSLHLKIIVFSPLFPGMFCLAICLYRNDNNVNRLLARFGTTIFIRSAFLFDCRLLPNVFYFTWHASLFFLQDFNLQKKMK